MDSDYHSMIPWEQGFEISIDVSDMDILGFLREFVGSIVN